MNSSSTPSRKAKSIAATDHNVACPGTDGISSLNFSPQNILVSSNWDSSVSCWQVQRDPQTNRIQAIPKAQVKHDNKSPVLDTCFSPDGGTVFSCGVEKTVRMWQLRGATNTTTIIGQHDAPIKSLSFIEQSRVIVSGGYDGKVKLWDARQQQPVRVLDMPERVYAMDCRGKWLVVATADRQITSYDVSSGEPQERFRKMSPLKYQTRCVAVFPDQKGFAVGSIEGRVGFQYLENVDGKDPTFTYRCHRQGKDVYPVNAIAFHEQQHGTFATVGSDGKVNFWDKDLKTKLQTFPQIERTIPCAAFSKGGDMFAYASSYDWSKGIAHMQPGNEIFIHAVSLEEISLKPKSNATHRR